MIIIDVPESFLLSALVIRSTLYNVLTCIMLKITPRDAIKACVHVRVTGLLPLNPYLSMQQITYLHKIVMNLVQSVPGLCIAP
jgi:hypothetical protein